MGSALPGLRKNHDDDTDEWDLDHLDNALNCFDGVAVEGGTDAAEEDDNCAGGACKI
ncbi:hypothetical protein [Neisseria leonii]|uniref:hypothetical protein n=1 Tax=Neisseria leonii TaxID=2995413 RepID=UPI00237AE4D5|nr:hypothetical protein [Neisseria sp. 3986]MDD9325118.1 hypothetical protein [Neisseria sp. 3986]